MHCSCELGKLARGVSKDCMRAGICLKLFVGEGRGGLGKFTKHGLDSMFWILLEICEDCKFVGKSLVTF